LETRARGIPSIIATPIKFARAFEQFVTLCRQALNPNLRKEVVEEMLVQHLLTERILLRVFGSKD
jgi:predicted helicase